MWDAKDVAKHAEDVVKHAEVGRPVSMPKHALGTYNYEIMFFQNFIIL